MQLSKQLGDFERSYLETALWSSHDNSDESGGNPLDQNYGIDAFSTEALQTMLQDCLKFRTSPAFQQAEKNNETVLTNPKRPEFYTACGHDFWLTRNGHGAGFWDGDYAEPYATTLTKLAKSFGECDIYVGDDGQLHFA